MRIGGKKENEINSRTGRSAGRKLLLTAKKTGIHAGKLLLDLLYPPRCPICDRILSRKEGLCCAGCEKKLPRVVGPVCMKCGKMIEREEDEYCEDCRKYAHVFTRGTAAFAYTGAMRHSVYRMKAENRRDYLDFYADAMAQALEPYLMRWQPERIIGVPMHWQKKWKRGYNQSELLAKKLAERTEIQIEGSWVSCCKKTKAQKTLNRKEREKNLSGCYILRKPEKCFRSVLIVDDVYTTGSTVDELARTLRKAGVEQVYFVVLCIGKGSGNGKKRVCTEQNVCYTKSESGYFHQRHR